MKETFILKVYRGEPGHQYWEEFELEVHPGDNVISCLMQIQKRPININNERVTPVAWESGCLEEVCGSCSMLVNGRPRQACTALIQTIIEKTGSKTISLAPFSKFPLVRDLVVDRSQMFEGLKKIRAWIDVDSSYGTEFGPLMSPEKQELIYAMSTCMTCGCCLEACPQINDHSDFIGPALTSQARLFNSHPVGKLKKSERLRPFMEKGGISECGNAQNCVEVCPKKIPLTDSIAAVGRDVTLKAFTDLFNLKDRIE